MPRSVPARRARIALLAAALSVGVAAPAPAAAQAPLALGTWQSFSWFDAAAPAVEPADGFTFTLLTPGLLRVVDGGVVGEVFDAAVVDLLLGTTMTFTTTAPDAAGAAPDLEAADGDAAWAAPAFSRGQLTLGAGSYRLALGVRATAPGYEFGDGFVRVDALDAAPTPAPTVAPEPASLALLAGGLAPLVVAVRGRARRQAAGAREG